MFLLVPAYPGCPGSKAVKRSLLLLLLSFLGCKHALPECAAERRHRLMIDISCIQGTQQQTRQTPLLLLIDGTDRRTLDRFINPTLQTTLPKFPMSHNHTHTIFTVILQVNPSSVFAFGALALLAGHREEHLVCKN